MIKTFRGALAESLYAGRCPKALENCRAPAERKLQQLESATALGDLRSPPGNRFEQLSGDRAGQYSIRINDQYRICFRWEGSDAYDVEILDYH